VTTPHFESPATSAPPDGSAEPAPSSAGVPTPTASALADLRGWLATAVGPDAAVEIAAPEAGHRIRLCLWPLALLADQGTRGGYGQRTLRLRARHAVIADGPVGDALALLDRVLTALAGEDRYQLVLEPVPPSLWGNGLPRPAVLIDVPVQISVAPAMAPRVTGELRLDGGRMRVIAGRVTGPGDVALVSMRVSSTSTGTSVLTDARGGFALSGQPAGRAVALELTGRGMRMQVEVGPTTTEPVLVTVPSEIPNIVKEV
jgi:hypothetical protein